MHEVAQAKEDVDKRKEEWKKMKKEIKKNKKELAKKIKQQGKMMQRNIMKKHCGIYSHLYSFDINEIYIDSQ